jgi:hypothetical protein
MCTLGPETYLSCFALLMRTDGNIKLRCIETKCIYISDCPKEWYEIYFVFACVWAFGAAMFQDQVQEFLYIHVLVQQNKNFT